MNYFRPQRPQSALLATPPPRKMSTPAGDRLSTILETNHNLHHTIHELDGREKSQWRRSHHSGKSGDTSGTAATPKTNNSLPRPSADTMPPLYMNKEWRPQRLPSQHENGSRPGMFQRIRSRRGGLGRILIILAILLVVIVALGVGLGIGLTRHNRSTSPSGTAASPSADGASSSSNQTFPLGQYTFTTALRSVQTDCVSDASTWRCYPYSIFSSTNSTDGLALFNWILTASGSIYAANGSTLVTNTTGIPANVSISSSQDPFSITLKNQSVTFINNMNNPRYSFSFVHDKSVVPSTDISGSNIASTCNFNQALFTATLYLSNSHTRDYPGAGLSGTSQTMGGYTAWPYAVEIQETAVGGSNVPACTANSNGQAIGNFTAESTTSTCICDYTNFSV